ncbi:hypothetical protein A4A49_59732, partial [Nicotiana attenuata]
IEHHHPLYLQPCDTSGSLIGKSKLAFVDGRCTKDKFDRSLHELWEKCNAIDKFDKVDGSRIFYLHKEIATLSQGISSVSAYFSILTNLWEEYDALMPCPGCDCPESKSYFEHFEYQRLLQFLIGLNKIYSQPRSQILMMSPAHTVNTAYSMVVSEESKRALGKFSQSVDIGDRTALFTNRGTNSGNNYKPRRGNLFCEYCNYKGHTRDNCFKLHGYPTDFKTRKKAIEGQQVMNASTANSAQGMSIVFIQEQYDQILKLINKDTGENSGFAGTTKTFVTNEIVKSENWTVDSGATNHMVHIGELLDKINTEILGNAPKVYLPDGTSLDVECTGESKIGENSIFRNVLYVPSFKYNLFSVSKLTRDLRCFVSFYPDFWIMQDLHSGKVKGIGKQLEGLYKL